MPASPIFTVAPLPETEFQPQTNYSSCLQMANSSDLLELETGGSLYEEEVKWRRQGAESKDYVVDWLNNNTKEWEKAQKLLPPDSPDEPADEEKFKRWREKLSRRSPPPLPRTKRRPNLAIEHAIPPRLLRENQVAAPTADARRKLSKQRPKKRNREPTGAIGLNKPGKDIDLDMRYVIRPIAYQPEVFSVKVAPEHPVMEDRYFTVRIPQQQMAALKAKRSGDWRPFIREGKLAIGFRNGTLIPATAHIVPRAPDKKPVDHRTHSSNCLICASENMVSDDEAEETPPQVRSKVVVRAPDVSARDNLRLRPPPPASPDLH